MARRNRLTYWRSLKLLRVEEQEASAVSTTRTSIGTGGSGSGGLDSATTLSLSLDSGEVVSLIDSAYVQARQITYDVQATIDSSYGSVAADFLPRLDSTYDLGSPTKKWKDLYLSGSSIYLGNWVLKEGPAGMLVVDSSGTNYQIPVVGDNVSSFVNDTNYLDSTTATQLIDSAYVQLRQSSVGSGGLDSAAVISLVDSAYVQLRQSASSGGGGGTDSAAVNILIDAKTQVLDIADIVGSTGNSGQYLKSLGNGNAEWGSVTSSSGSGLADWQKKSTDYTLSSGDRIAVNTDSAWTLTLPASPTFSDEVYIIDAKGNAAVKNITVSGNGEKILASDSDLIINVNRASIAMMYYGDSQGWILTSTF